MKHIFSVLALSTLLSVPGYLQSEDSCPPDRVPEDSLVEVSDEDFLAFDNAKVSTKSECDCVIITCKIKRPTSAEDWQKIVEMLKEVITQQIIKGDPSNPAKAIHALEEVLIKIFATDEVDGEISVEFALEKCPCENKAKCGDNCDCGALECKEMQMTKGTCCS